MSRKGRKLLNAKKFSLLKSYNFSYNFLVETKSKVFLVFTVDMPMQYLVSLAVIVRKDFVISIDFSLMNRIVAFLIIAVLGGWFSSCQKEHISSSPSLKLSFSTDTVLFDTVFTTVGSATRSFKVYNRNRSDISISSVRLAGGSSSAYRLNIDGEATNHASDILLRGKDSLFVFVEVTVDPTSENAPMLIPDSVVFETNGNIQDVKLVSWGQDVHLFNADTILTNTTFMADKPYLIYNYLWVYPNVELAIEPGAKLHFHNQAQLIVSGSIKVNGGFENPVTFEGDRLEPFYRDKAGQWGGIWLAAGSHSNEIDWAEIKNGIIGLIVDTVGVEGEPTLVISNSKVENMSAAGLYARGAEIEASNCLFGNASQISVALTLGGRYRFYHCTIANYWAQYINRTGPALLLNNYYTYTPEGSSTEMLETRDLEEAYFGNCIVYGSRQEEFQLDNVYNGQPVDAQMNYFFESSIVRVGQDINIDDEAHFLQVTSENPLFVDPYEYDYRLDAESPAINVGLLDIAIQYPFDLNNLSRTSDAGPDIGAYEWIEEEE